MSPKTPASGIERRKARRRPILDTFSLFVVLPKKGGHRLKVNDLSDSGISFDFDTEAEEASGSPLKSGETLETHFYLNQSLFIPLSVRIVRLEDRNEVRRVGAELLAKGAGFEPVQAFLTMLDKVADAGQIA
jgi:hypothetical protein